MNKAILPIVAAACLAIGAAAGYFLGQPGKAPNHELPELPEPAQTTGQQPTKPPPQSEVRMHERVEPPVTQDKPQAGLGAAIEEVVAEPPRGGRYCRVVGS